MSPARQAPDAIPGSLDETRPPRESEALDEGRLAAWLFGRLNGTDQPMQVEQFTRGKANLTYLLKFGDDPATEFVLRRPPHGDLPPGAHDIAREHRVLSTLWRAFDKASKSFVYCDDRSILGVPFLIMERRHGIVVQDAIPEVFGGGADEAQNRAISETVIDTLAEFHAVDPEAAGLGTLGRPDGFLRRQLAGWSERLRAAGVTPLGPVEELEGWLRERLPATSAVTLVHNDWRLDNLALDPNDPGRCTAVYDWDMCTRGDPLADLGTLLSGWYEDEEPPEGFCPMPTGVRGFLSRAAAIERYCNATGRSPDEVRWYLVFGTFKMAGILQQIYHRWRHGQTDDPRFETMDRSASALVHLALLRRHDHEGGEFPWSHTSTI